MLRLDILNYKAPFLDLLQTVNLSRLIGVATLKIATQVCSFVLIILITRTLGAEQSGVYLYAHNIIILLAGVAMLGLNSLVVKAVGSSGFSDESNRTVNQSLVWTGCFSIFIFSILIAFDEILFNKLNIEGLHEITTNFSPAIFGLAVGTIVGCAFQGAHKQSLNVVFTGLGINALMIILICAIHLSGFLNLTASSISLLYSAATIAIALFSLAVWYRQRDTNFIKFPLKDFQLFERSRYLWFAFFLGMLVKNLSIFISGYYVNAEDLALLSVSVRTSDAMAMILMTINMFTPPLFARYWHQKNVPQLKKLLNSSSLFSLILSTPILILVCLFSSEIMSLFGNEFKSAGTLLIILCLGQFIRNGFGLTTELLNMCGFERYVMYTSIFSVIFTALFCLILIPKWGILGAAYACAISMISVCLGSVFYTRKKIGFWIFS